MKSYTRKYSDRQQRQVTQKGRRRDAQTNDQLAEPGLSSETMR